MKEIKTAKTTTPQKEGESWPPPPTSPAKSREPYPKKPYLTSSGRLDTVVGIIAGLAFNWLLFYGITTYILYYLMSHEIRFFWHVVVGCIFTLVASFFIWICLRVLYRRLANTFICTGILLCSALMYFFD